MATTTGERDIVRLIRDQHDEIKRLFSKVETRPSDDRRDAFECLVRLLAVHETAEEEGIYPVVRSAELGGDDIADDRLQEQSNAKNMLSDLERIGVDSPASPRCATPVLRHTESEEHTVLALLERPKTKPSLTAWGRPSGPQSRWHPRTQRRRTRQCSRQGGVFGPACHGHQQFVTDSQQPSGDDGMASAAGAREAEWVSVARAAQATGASEAWIMDRCRDGRLPHRAAEAPESSGTDRMVPLATVRALVDGRISE